MINRINRAPAWVGCMDYSRGAKTLNYALFCCCEATGNSDAMQSFCQRHNLIEVLP